MAGYTAELVRVTITPEQAAKWLDKYKMDVQRPFRQKWVSQLVEMMKSGKFDGDSVIRLYEVNGETHLIDGKHRLKGVVQAGLPQSFYVITNQAFSEEELIEKFRIRNDGKPVTGLDYALAMKLDTETGLSRWQLNRILGSVMYFVTGFDPRWRGNEITIQEKVNLIRKYSESAGYYYEALTGGKQMVWNQLNWACVIAVALVTFQESVNEYGFEKVFDFWNGVSQMKNTGEDSRSTMSTMLMHYCPPGSGDNTKEQRSSEWIARYVAACFNAWTENRFILRSHPDVGKPIRINGSQYKG